MKKTILHTIIAALILLVIGGGVISVLDADWKDTAKKVAMSAAALGVCWYPVSIAAQLAGASAESKVRALINGLVLNRSIDYISLSLSQQAFIDTTCPDVANRTAFYTVALIGMSPAFYFVYKLLTKKGKPEPALPASWLPTTTTNSDGSIIQRPHPISEAAILPQSANPISSGTSTLPALPHPTPKATILPQPPKSTSSKITPSNPILSEESTHHRKVTTLSGPKAIATPTSSESLMIPIDSNKDKLTIHSTQQEVSPTQTPWKGKEIIEEEERFNSYKEENKLPADVTWENMSETERVRYLRWKHYIATKKEEEYFNRYKQEKNLPADLALETMSKEDKDRYYYWRNWKIVTEF